MHSRTLTSACDGAANRMRTKAKRTPTETSLDIYFSFSLLRRIEFRQSTQQRSVMHVSYRSAPAGAPGRSRQEPVPCRRSFRHHSRLRDRPLGSAKPYVQLRALDAAQMDGTVGAVVADGTDRKRGFTQQGAAGRRRNPAPPAREKGSRLAKEGADVVPARFRRSFVDRGPIQPHAQPGDSGPKGISRPASQAEEGAVRRTPGRLEISDRLMDRGLPGRRLVTENVHVLKRPQRPRQAQAGKAGSRLGRR